MSLIVQILICVYLCGACVSAFVQILLGAAQSLDELAPPSWRTDLDFILTVAFWPVALIRLLG